VADMGVENWISTRSGNLFNFDEPSFNIKDIGHALGMTCRFGGHCEYFYSVAEHSILVSEIMEEQGHDPMEGLLHDACEAYLGDVVSPLKARLPEYKLIESRIDKVFRKEYNLPETMSAECKLADTIAVLIEAHQLILPETLKKWNYVIEDVPALQMAKDLMSNGWCIFGLVSKVATDQFLDRYDKQVQE
jgi:hypothetical protein